MSRSLFHFTDVLPPDQIIDQFIIFIIRFSLQCYLNKGLLKQITSPAELGPTAPLACVLCLSPLPTLLRGAADFLCHLLPSFTDVSLFVFFHMDSHLIFSSHLYFVSFHISYKIQLPKVLSSSSSSSSSRAVSYTHLDVYKRQARYPYPQRS